MILQAYSDGKDLIWADASGKVWNFHPFEDIGMGNMTFRLGRPNNIQFGKPRTSQVHPAVLEKAKSKIKAKAPSQPVPGRRIPFGLPRELAIRARGGANLKPLTPFKPSVIDPKKEHGVFLPSKITLPQKQKEKSKIGKFFDRIKEGDVDITKIAGDVRSIVRELKPKQQINPKVLNPQQGRPTPGPNPTIIRRDGSNQGANNSSDDDSTNKKLLIGGGILLILAAGVYVASNQKKGK